MEKVINESLFDNDEMTRYGFISNMEHFMKQLIKDPLHARVSDRLKKHGIDEPKAIEILTKPADPNDPTTAILIKKERIENGDIDEEGHRGKDTFHIKYSIPRKDYDKKMRNLYIKLFEAHYCDNPVLDENHNKQNKMAQVMNEDGEGAMAGGGMEGVEGATNSQSSGQFTTPLFGKPMRRKTLYITEEQLEAIKEATTTFDATPQGNAMGDMTPPGAFGDKETLDHKNMMKKSWKGNA